jgi:hypothetical protein
METFTKQSLFLSLSLVLALGVLATPATAAVIYSSETQHSEYNEAEPGSGDNSYYFDMGNTNSDTGGPRIGGTFGAGGGINGAGGGGGGFGGGGNRTASFTGFGSGPSGGGRRQSRRRRYLHDELRRPVPAVRRPETSTAPGRAEPCRSDRLLGRPDPRAGDAGDPRGRFDGFGPDAAAAQVSAALTRHRPIQTPSGSRRGAFIVQAQACSGRQAERRRRSYG